MFKAGLSPAEYAKKCIDEPSDGIKHVVYLIYLFEQAKMSLKDYLPACFVNIGIISNLKTSLQMSGLFSETNFSTVLKDPDIRELNVLLNALHRERLLNPENFNLLMKTRLTNKPATVSFGELLSSTIALFGNKATRQDIASAPPNIASAHHLK